MGTDIMKDPVYQKNDKFILTSPVYIHVYWYDNTQDSMDYKNWCNFHLFYDSIILPDDNAERHWSLEIENVTQFII